MKHVSIPRLELVAALLAAKLTSQLIKDLDVQFNHVRLWTDSKIVLHYLRNTSSRYATFVAYRIRQIRELTLASQWYYVPTDDNPADIGSRGTEASSPKLSTWLYGPGWLKLSENEWPQSNDVEVINIESLEVKRNVFVVHKTDQHSWLFEYSMRCATWSRLLKTVVWLTRFKTYMTLKLTSRTDLSLPLGVIKIEELKQATVDNVRMTQSVAFSRERTVASDGSILCTATDLRRLRPNEHQGVLSY